MAKPKADTLYQCIESFVAAGEAGTPSYSRGMRLAGSHPAVQKYPQYFLEDSVPDDDVMRARQKLWAAAGAVLSR
jgi:hypothetical protein